MKPNNKSKHGDWVECPACGGAGQLDTHTPKGEPIPFAEWVVYNPNDSGWECHECWMK